MYAKLTKGRWIIAAFFTVVFILNSNVHSDEPKQSESIFPRRYASLELLISNRQPESFIVFKEAEVPFVVLKSFKRTGRMQLIYAIYFIRKDHVCELVSWRILNSFSADFILDDGALIVKDSLGSIVEKISVASLSLAADDYVWDQK